MGYLMFVRSPDDLITKAEAEFPEVRGIGTMFMNTQCWSSLEKELEKIGVPPSPVPVLHYVDEDGHGYSDPHIAQLSREQCTRAAEGLRRLVETGGLEKSALREKPGLEGEELVAAAIEEMGWEGRILLFAGLCDNAVNHGDGLVLSQ